MQTQSGKPHDIRPGGALALTLSGPRGIRLYAVDEIASKMGLHVEMPLADARAICPDLRTIAADIAADEQALYELAHWCMRYSPWVSTDGADGIYIDISGCAHLFGGEQPMAADILKQLNSMNVPARTAIADTAGAAHALARFLDRQISIVPQGKAKIHLTHLPVQALRIDPDIAASLRRLGLKRIGQLYDIPRHSLARRFGVRNRKSLDTVLTRLDQALGKEAEPITPLAPAPKFQVRQPFAQSLTDAAGLEPFLKALLERLCRFLRQEDKGAKRLTFTAFRNDGSTTRLTVGTNKPSRDPAHLLRLFQERLGTLDPGFGIDLVLLSADTVFPMTARQSDLTGSMHSGIDLSTLLDRLALRLGYKHIGQLFPCESHIPERAEYYLPGLNTTASKWGVTTHPSMRRPLRIFPQPEPIEICSETKDGLPLIFSWRRTSHHIARTEGPERILPEWWQHHRQNKTAIRDYYHVEDREGLRFWLYRETSYPGASTRPRTSRWFVHGLFA